MASTCGPQEPCQGELLNVTFNGYCTRRATYPWAVSLGNMEGGGWKYI